MRFAFLVMTILLGAYVAQADEACRAKLTVACGDHLSATACNELRAHAFAAFAEGRPGMGFPTPLCEFFPVGSVEMRFRRGEIEMRAKYSEAIAKRLCIPAMTFLWAGEDTGSVIQQSATEIEDCNAMAAMGGFYQAVSLFALSMRDVFSKFVLEDYMAGRLAVILTGQRGTEIAISKGESGGLEHAGLARVKVDGKMSLVGDQSFPEAFAKARRLFRR